MKEEIVSTKKINSTTTEVTLTSGRKVDVWHGVEGEIPQVGEYMETDNLINPFEIELTRNGVYDQRKKGHRSPFY